MPPVTGAEARVFEREATESLEEGEDKPLAAFLRVGAEDFLGTLEDNLLTRPPVPQQVMSSTPTKAYSVFHFEQCVSDSIGNDVHTPTKVPQQVHPSASSNEILGPFEREATELLEQDQNKTPAVFFTYEQRMPTCLLPCNNDSRRPFVRESTEPLEEEQDKPPAASMKAHAIVDLDEYDMADPILAPVVEQNHPFGPGVNMPIPSESFHTLPHPVAIFRSPDTGRHVVLNRLDRPVRRLTREQLKRALGGPPCDPSVMVTSAAQASHENQGNDADDEDECEERTDPTKRARRDLGKEPLRSSLAPSEKSGLVPHAVHTLTTPSRGLLRGLNAQRYAQSCGAQSQLHLLAILSSLPQHPQLIQAMPSTPCHDILRRCTNASSDVNMGAWSSSRPLLSSLLIDELNRKNARHKRNPQRRQQQAADAARGADRNVRQKQNYRDDWINAHRRKGPVEDDSISSCLGEPANGDRGMTSFIGKIQRPGARFRRSGAGAVRA
ncbi:hypothetical protein J3A83DRAFT_4409822 [Scleroderma citrinum]